MLESVFWFVVVPFVFAFILGFITFGVYNTTPPNAESQEASDSTLSG